MSNGKDLFWESESADGLWENDFCWADAKALRGLVRCYNTLLRADGPRSPLNRQMDDVLDGLRRVGWRMAEW